MIAYESVDFPEPFGPMIACTSFRSTSRSTPFTISVPSSRETWRFSSVSKPTKVSSSFGKSGAFAPHKLRLSLAEQARAPNALRGELNGSCGDRGERGADEHAAQTQRRPQRGTAGARVEAAVRAGIARHRLEQVVRRVERLRLVRVLPLPAHPQQHQVAEAR